MTLIYVILRNITLCLIYDLKENSVAHDFFFFNFIYSILDSIKDKWNWSLLSKNDSFINSDPVNKLTFY